MLTTQEQTIAVQKLSPKRSAEERMKQERMRDIQLLLENLFEREDKTVIMILDSLYDVGLVNLINRKFPRQPLNPLMKSIARSSKPVFKVVALRWFKKNVPNLLTKWLQSKVKF